MNEITKAPVKSVGEDEEFNRIIDNLTAASTPAHRGYAEANLIAHIDSLLAARTVADAPDWNAVQVCTWIGNQLMNQPGMFERGEVCKFVRSLGRDERLVKHFATPAAAPTDLGAAMRQIDDTLLYCKNKHAHVNGTRAKLVAARAVVASIIASQPSAIPQAASLSVKLTEMHESNGNVTWSVLLAKSPEEQPWDCHTVYTDTIKGRAEYEADSLKHFLGLGPEPDMLEYDTDVPAAVPQAVAVPEEIPSIRTYPEFVEDLERLSEPGLSKKMIRVIRKEIYDTIDARVRNYVGRAAIPATPSGEVPP